MNTYQRVLAWLKSQVGTKEFPNRNKLAEHLGMPSPSKLYETLDNKRVPKADSFFNWLDTLGVSIRLPSETESSSSEFYPIPKVRARLAGSHGGSLETDDDIEGFYAFKYSWLMSRGTPSRCVLMSVVGESMIPTLNDGDMVLVDQSQCDVWAGKIYAVGIEDTVVVKRLEKLPGQLILRSDNPVYEPISLKLEEFANFRIIGRVIWTAREFI